MMWWDKVMKEKLKEDGVSVKLYKRYVAVTHVTWPFRDIIVMMISEHFCTKTDSSSLFFIPLICSYPLNNAFLQVSPCEIHLQPCHVHSISYVTYTFCNLHFLLAFIQNSYAHTHSS